MPVLGAEAALELLTVRQVGELVVALDRPRDLEAGRTQEADVLPNGSVDRHEDLGGEEAVVPGPALRGVPDPVPEEVVPPERCRRHAEGGVREVGVHDGQPAGDHRSAADVALVRGLVLHHRAEVRARLHDR